MARSRWIRSELGENSKNSRHNRHNIDSLITQGTMIAASILKAEREQQKRQPDNSRHNRHYIDSLITQGTMTAASILKARKTAKSDSLITQGKTDTTSTA